MTGLISSTTLPFGQVEFCSKEELDNLLREGQFLLCARTITIAFQFKLNDQLAHYDCCL